VRALDGLARDVGERAGGDELAHRLAHAGELGEIGRVRDRREDARERAEPSARPRDEGDGGVGEPTAREREGEAREAREGRPGEGAAATIRGRRRRLGGADDPAVRRAGLDVARRARGRARVEPGVEVAHRAPRGPTPDADADADAKCEGTRTREPTSSSSEL
jgi:hypothetical protein